MLNLGYSEYKHCLLWAGSTCDETILTHTQAKQLLRESGAWMLRNIYDWDCKEKTNFWEIICDTVYPIEELPSKTRNQVRRSLRDCDIRIISPKELIDADGYNVYKKAFERYHDITVHNCYTRAVADRHCKGKKIRILGSLQERHQITNCVCNEFCEWSRRRVQYIESHS